MRVLLHFLFVIRFLKTLKWTTIKTGTVVIVKKGLTHNLSLNKFSNVCFKMHCLKFIVIVKNSPNF